MTSSRLELRCIRAGLLAAIGLLLLPLISVAALAPHEGFVPVPGGPVWYRVFGSGTATPLLIVHGGPGSSSCAFEPLATRVSQDRPVVVYDQLGSGRSGRPMDTSLWTADRSVRELAAVRQALGLQRVHLMGHSWGGAVVADYVMSAHPVGVVSLVLGAPLLSTRVWVQDADILRRQLPADVQDVLTRNEAAGTVESAEYQAATDVFYDHFLHHQAVKRPAGCGESPSNNAIYELMWGPTEFHATGSLLNFDVTPGLVRLRLPVLFIGGRYDEARPETLAKFQADVPGSSIKILENSGHMAPLEEYDAYAAALRAFFDAVEARATPAARHPRPDAPRAE